MFSIGVDIGGTFTDFSVYNRRTGEMLVEKCLSTPHEPQRGVMTGLGLLAQRIPDLAEHCERINHATTLVTNAILERKGARTALLTTAGFCDIIEQGAEIRYNVYDLFITFPPPIVPRRLRYGVKERIFADGSIAEPLDEAQVVSIAQELKAQKIEAVAICYLHAYRNSAHERRTAEILCELLPGVAISVSYEVSPEPREFERTSTTALDAYVKPVVDTYLARLQQDLLEKGIERRLEVMLSNGGSATVAIARQFPIQLIESGPAAGVEAAIWICGQTGIENALSFDMGGTTAKLCIIEKGLATRSRRFEAGRVHRFVQGSGLPVSVPVYELVEIGAGGGSIARVDALGLISVGPESAGADPGPACYANGGLQPTVTDADLVLGHIDANYFLGGEMRLDPDAAERAIADHIAAPLALSIHEAAYGIFDLVNETMAAAARLHIAEKGCDPTKLSIIAFGGAGPLHAIELARKLGCPRVVFPPLAGVMSSVGLLTAPPAFERLETIKRRLDLVSREQIEAGLKRLKAEISTLLESDEASVEFRFTVEMSHQGQEYPIEVSFVPQDLGDALTGRLRQRFAERYRELFGRSDDDNPVELSTLRVSGSLPARRAMNSRTLFTAGDRSRGYRKVYNAETRSLIEVEVLNRSMLAPGTEIDGPIVVQERESGFAIRKGDHLLVHESGAIFVDLS